VANIARSDGLNSTRYELVRAALSGSHRIHEPGPLIPPCPPNSAALLHVGLRFQHQQVAPVNVVARASQLSIWWRALSVSFIPTMSRP
jgi:hypothetical protein